MSAMLWFAVGVVVGIVALMLAAVAVMLSLAFVDRGDGGEQ